MSYGGEANESALRLSKEGSTGMGKRVVVPRLRESRPLAAGREFTQLRDYSLAGPSKGRNACTCSTENLLYY